MLIKHQSITIYPSPYTVVSNQGYTKHYYAGAERVAARLGGGGLGYDTACISQNPEVSRCADILFQHVLKSVNSYEYQKQDSLDVVRIDGSVLGEASGFNGDNFPIRLNADVRAEPWRLNRIIEGLSDSVNPIVIDSSYEPDVYFYHSDHLGSASWITDAEGIPVQHLQLYYHARFSSTRSTGACTTFGEPFVNQRISGYQERFTFTGKERDEETGYSYFGARYMDHEIMTMWLSVDPMADKYPWVSPYNYCLWNPVKLLDPDGNSPIKGITSAIKIARKAYNIYKKTGKLTPKALKKAGLSELVDIAGDMVTIFSGDASVLDRVAAVADLVIGTNFNTQGNRKVVEKAALITKKGPPANRGKAKPHGGEKHNNAIDDYIGNLPEGSDGVRKNQVQVDINGNRVGNNRPDVQYDYNGQHHNVEFDNNPSNGVKHEKTIRKK